MRKCQTNPMLQWFLWPAQSKSISNTLTMLVCAWSGCFLQGNWCKASCNLEKNCCGHISSRNRRDCNRASQLFALTFQESTNAKKKPSAKICVKKRPAIKKRPAAALTAISSPVPRAPNAAAPVEGILSNPHMNSCTAKSPSILGPFDKKVASSFSRSLASTDPQRA